MSLRQLRKMYNNAPSLPPPHSSDEEFEPTFVKNPKKSQYEGLVLSSSAESDCEEKLKSEEEQSETETKKQKERKKNNRKLRKNRQLKKTQKNSFGMDEIDKSLLEVNAMLGEPKNKPPTPQSEPRNAAAKVLCVQFKYLVASEELNRLFGPEEPDDDTKIKRPRVQNLRCDLGGSFIQKNFNLRAKGLSMTVNRREDGYTYFTYNHSKEYQTLQGQLITTLKHGVRYVMVPIEMLIRTMHVEEMLEEADVRFRADQHVVALDIVETAISYMLSVTSPFFNVTNPETRLEYKFVENRAFHILLLKYAYLASHKACHRTALEVTKLLLNLDPSDPLAVQTIIDVFALRAREYKWLIDAIDYFELEKDGNSLFNMIYSSALAHFHIIRKEKTDMKKADLMLKTAIMKFPTFVLDVLEAAGLKPPPNIENCSLYKEFALTTTSSPLRQSIKLYAHLTCSMWRIKPVLQWFLRVVNELEVSYTTEHFVKENIHLLSHYRQLLYTGWPDEVLRHFLIIQPMSKEFADGIVPKLPTSFAFNPVPPANTVDRYNYSMLGPHPVDPNTPLFMLRFYSSVYPGYFVPYRLPGRNLIGLRQEFGNNEERNPNSIPVALFTPDPAEELAVQIALGEITPPAADDDVHEEQEQRQ